MSKLNGKFSYKKWCILKHGLENSIERKEEWIDEDKDTYKEDLEKLEEEKVVLKEVTELINDFKEKNGIK